MQSSRLPEKWKQTATLCPLDRPSNYSLLRLWHVPKDLHQFVDQLNQQLNHRQETMQEVEQGWLAEEPFPDLERHFVAKRFPIQQKDKTRLIDDFSICGVNSAFGMTEKLRVDSIDEIVAGCGRYATFETLGSASRTSSLTH